MKKNNKQKISIIFISIILFSILGGFGANALLNNVNISTNENLTNTNVLKTSQIERTDISIAIYNEANTTEPTYSGWSVLTNNYTGLTTLLDATGYNYSELTTDDILNHKLLSADFDVFIIVDNLPKDNIVNFVKEFWLGGGSILSFDSALSYLMYAGILIPESEGDENYNTYWNYGYTSLTQNISTRHPATKTYQVGDQYTLTKISNAQVIWSSLAGTSFEDDLIKLSNIPDHNNRASGIALDPTQKGGKVIQLPGTVEEINSTFENLILDSIQWLCPIPKARILFDLSHDPYYSIDSWDTDYAHFGNKYTLWRNSLVNRSYTIDKLYPSVSGNLTLSNLADYDILIEIWPESNFTSSEIGAVQNWVNNGGSLFVLGERTAGDRNKRLNDLLTSYEISLDLSPSGSNTMTYLNDNHPVTEACSQITGGSVGELIISSSASYIAGNDASTITVASQDVGQGRLVVFADINAMDNDHINTDDNAQFFINIMNWLSANDAKILTYIAEDGSPDPNDNIYRGPVSKALNILEKPFYITFDREYFNLSLINYDWDLVIIDNTANYLVEFYYKELIQYLKNGGRLILSTWEYRRTAPIPLWDYIGFEHAGNHFTTPPIIHLWSTIHPIFNNPIDYDSTTIETTLDYSATDASNLTVYSNATSIAGLSASAQNTGCSIILGAGGNAIINGFHVTEYSDDTDDSTYPDSLEIWMNEISYSFRPYSFVLSSNADDPDDDGIFNLQWTASDLADSYDIFQQVDTGPIAQIASDLTTTSYSLSGLSNGNYSFYIIAKNDNGQTKSNTLEIEVNIPSGDAPSGGIPGFNFIILCSTSIFMIGIISMIKMKRKEP